MDEEETEKTAREKEEETVRNRQKEGKGHGD